MAMPASPIRVDPKFTLVSAYTVNRIGKFPSVTVRYTECSYLLTAPLVVLMPTDADEDGLFETLLVEDVTPYGITAPVGHILSTAASDTLATVIAAEQVVISPAVVDENFVVVTPEHRGTKLTFSVGLTEAQIAAPLHLVDRMPVGTTAYQPTPGGRVWESNLWGNNAQAMGEMGTLLGGAYFQAAKALIGKLGAQITDAQILGAIQALAAEGTNLDGFLAQQGEALEGRRLAGQLPFVQAMGNPPRTA